MFQMSGDEKISRLKPRFKLWLSLDSDRGGFGIGKWELLDAIDKYGSLSSAVNSLGISYRKAWGDLKESEKFLGFKLIEKHRGGNLHGETVLTEQGKIFLEIFKKFYNDIEKAVDEAFEKYFVNNLLL